MEKNRTQNSEGIMVKKKRLMMILLYLLKELVERIMVTAVAGANLVRVLHMHTAVHCTHRERLAWERALS